MELKAASWIKNVGTKEVGTESRKLEHKKHRAISSCTPPVVLNIYKVQTKYKFFYKLLKLTSSVRIFPYESVFR